jgi:ABC-type dipeptide/oligopeptide/nickel transport system permease component
VDEVEARTVTTDRIAGAFVLVVLAACCLVFWIGVPLAVLWGLSKATDDAATHFVSGLLGVPLAMAAFSPLLFWLNNLYLRVTGVLDRLAEDEEESGWQRRLRGPLEPMMMLSLVVAIIALCVWFFFIAEDPPRQVI